jgi:hypothetical protein
VTIFERVIWDNASHVSKRTVNISANETLVINKRMWTFGKIFKDGRTPLKRERLGQVREVESYWDSWQRAARVERPMVGPPLSSKPWRAYSSI